jgi:hypothetical protein
MYFTTVEVPLGPLRTVEVRVEVPSVIPAEAQAVWTRC